MAGNGEHAEVVKAVDAILQVKLHPQQMHVPEHIEEMTE
jgi:hypothetical protein